jgi:hypothetical protein
MSTLRRTPVNFPRMKVRGRRNKAKVSARHRDVTLFPHVIAKQCHDGILHTTTFTVAAAYEPGAFEMRVEQVRDGWGRPVGNAHVALTPAAPPNPKTIFDLSFTVPVEVDRDVVSAFFGGDA